MKTGTEDLIRIALKSCAAGDFEAGGNAASVIERHRLLTNEGLDLFRGHLEDYAGIYGGSKGAKQAPLIDMGWLDRHVAGVIAANGKGKEAGPSDDIADDVEARACQLLAELLADHEHGYVALREEDVAEIRRLKAASD